MSGQCDYDRSGQWDVYHLKEEARGLRTDVDNLLGEMMALRQANLDLTKLVRVLRDRVDSLQIEVAA